MNRPWIYTTLPILFILFLLVPSCSQQKAEEADASTSDAWYRNILIYNLDVNTFQDSDGDGIGDFAGLTSRLDYLKNLGVDVIWLAPFQPSPGRDDGYDVADYYSIDERFGTEADFTTFMQEAKSRGIKVIMDAVLNHTSIEHPWYQEARSDSSSKYRSWYVWSGEKPDDSEKGMAFEGDQEETWTYDQVAEQYYFHRFYDFQPDLNYENPEVQQEALKILKYWLEKGVDGFRLDAVPFIIDIPRTGSDDPELMFKVLADLTREVKHIKPDVLLLGEANVATDANKKYFGQKGERLTMMFNFYANQYLFYALASGDTGPFADALSDTREKPDSSQWGYFLRNHDEIDLGRLSKSERNQVYEAFGPETNMQLYNRGIRRRLAPMLGDSLHLRMAYSLLFSLPGTPVIRSGEEIGMGDDLTLQERLSVRTPMQWSAEKHAGFTKGDKPIRPLISAGDYRYQKVNVAAQQENEASLLNFIRQLVQLRKENPMIGYAQWQIVETGNDAVLAIHYQHQNKQLLAVHNFSEEPQAVQLKLPAVGVLSNLFTKQQITSNQNTIPIKLDRYGFGWFASPEQQASED